MFILRFNFFCWGLCMLNVLAWNLQVFDLSTELLWISTPKVFQFWSPLFLENSLWEQIGAGLLFLSEFGYILYMYTTQTHCMSAWCISVTNVQRNYKEFNDGTLTFWTGGAGATTLSKIQLLESVEIHFFSLNKFNFKGYIFMHLLQLAVPMFPYTFRYLAQCSMHRALDSVDSEFEAISFK